MPRNAHGEPLAPLEREDIQFMLDEVGLSAEPWQIDLLVQVLNSDGPLTLDLGRRS